MSLSMEAFIFFTSSQYSSRLLMGSFTWVPTAWLWMDCWPENMALLLGPM